MSDQCLTYDNPSLEMLLWPKLKFDRTVFKLYVLNLSPLMISKTDWGGKTT